MWRCFGKPKPAPADASTAGATVQMCFGAHNVGYYVDVRGKQLDIGLGRFSLLIVNKDLQVLYGKLKTSWQDANNFVGAARNLLSREEMLRILTHAEQVQSEGRESPGDSP